MIIIAFLTLNHRTITISHDHRRHSVIRLYVRASVCAAARDHDSLLASRLTNRSSKFHHFTTSVKLETKMS